MLCREGSTRCLSISILLISLACAAIPALAGLKPVAPRVVINLDGPWQVEQGKMDARPEAFSHMIPVPGLMDMARPPFEEVGRGSHLREAFWYRRTFRLDGTIPDVAILKINKAKYGTKVWVNDRIAGEHLPCFTPAFLDIKRLLKGNGQENELVIRIGADRESLPEGMPTGWDFEKYLFIPGIYDSVELILTGRPYISSIQAVPVIKAKSVRLVAEVEQNAPTNAFPLTARVKEVSTGRDVGSIKAGRSSGKVVDLTIPIRDCRLWSPESPFLYELQLSTGSDAASIRFGMRSFRFDPQAGRAVLNDKVYFMRGSNVTIYRFFEDSERRDRPWRAEWVRNLHRKFKSMHWNSLRYCIGFPPEIWYEIADEEGFLIQDEFPIWLLDKAPENPRAEKIIPEYTEWMRERWNHPCVVIWDAQNESFTAETGRSLQAVRQLDLSNRPWENGWGEPQSATDCVEAHPYEFQRTQDGGTPFHMKEIAGWSGVPSLQSPQMKRKVPIIINEYAWLWLTRDGNPTCLTDKIYADLLGFHSTTEQRRLTYARYLAALTEFWRCHREVAGVLHFCGLGYSRPGNRPRPEGGATSDHFVDMENLVFEPLFEEFVRDAFNPVGLMLDLWDEEVAAGTGRQLRVFVINDLYRDWEGDVRLSVSQEGKSIQLQMQPCKVPALDRQILTFEQSFPAKPGNYTIVADLTDADGKVVRSLRDFAVLPSGQTPRR